MFDVLVVENRGYLASYRLDTEKKRIMFLSFSDKQA
jgi:hypothetical protein